VSESVKPDAASLVASAEWYLFNFTVGKRQFDFTAVTEEDYHASVFLDHRMTVSRQQKFSLGFMQTLELFLSAGPPHTTLSWIFHMGHCGSTLLSRALDFSEAVLPLREPQTLKLLSDIQRELGQPVCLFTQHNFEQLRDVFIFSLSRIFRPGQRPMVKATSTCNNLVLPLMDAAPGSRAVLLYQPLEQHVAGRTGSPAGIFDLFRQARVRMLDWMAIPGAPILHNSHLAPEQLAVLAWVSSMYLLLEAHKLQAQRTCLVNFEDFLAAPGRQLQAIADFLGLDVTAEALGAHYERISQHHSKNPEKPFTASDRHRKLGERREKQAKRITPGMRWAEQLIRTVPALEPLGDYLE
jgi:hypothetical protein